MIEYFIHFFIILALFSAILVISANHPIHSVFALIALFLFSTTLLFTLNIDFLAILLLVVYVGAIAVLFLFVVMMLHLNLALFHENLLRYLPIATLFAFTFLLQAFSLANFIFQPSFHNSFFDWSSFLIPSIFYKQIFILSSVLYTQYFIFFLIAALILFVAMIGTIVLTLHQSPIHNKRQNPNLQLLRSYNTIIFI